MPEEDRSGQSTETSFSTQGFGGGMVRVVDSSLLGEDQYSLLINGRSRYQTIKSIKRPKDWSDYIPTGNFQGIIAADPYIILFISGMPYLVNAETSAMSGRLDFSMISSFSKMDPDVEFIFMEKVPASNTNFVRKLINSSNIKDDVWFGSALNETPQAIVCQDGINQPRLILDNATTRLANTFNQWKLDEDNPDNDNREYVPVGKQMVHSGDILYIISPDGKEIYRSVFGRPLDFVIAIDNNGNKLSPLPDGQQEASRMSHSVGYDPIIALNKINTKVFDMGVKGSFFVSTGKFSWIVAPDFSTTLFGEPRFVNIDLFSTGPVNNFSLTDVLGDVVFVDSAGLRSFNAIANLSAEGDNSPFSKTVDELFEGIIQTQTAAITSGNYTYFGMLTKFGVGILVYDNLNENFASLDIFDNVTGAIKQFVEVKAGGKRRLFFITYSNRLYEYEADNIFAQCKLYTKEWIVEDETFEQVPRSIYTRFLNGVGTGNITAKAYVDRQGTFTKTKQFIGEDSISTISAIPFNEPINRSTKPFVFKIEDSALRGKKVGIYITFDFEGELSMIQVITKLMKTKVPIEQAAANYIA